MEAKHGSWMVVASRGAWGLQSTSSHAIFALKAWKLDGHYKFLQGRGGCRAARRVLCRPLARRFNKFCIAFSRFLLQLAIQHDSFLYVFFIGCPAFL